MCVGLQNGGPGSSHLSPFPPHIAGGANPIKTTMWAWESFPLRERELPCCLFGSIHIHHDPLLTKTIPQAAWRGERLAGHEIFLEERPQCLYRHWIKRGKKAGECRARGEAMATKERHKGVRKGQESLRKGFEAGLR